MINIFRRLLDSIRKAIVEAMGTLIQNTSLLYIFPLSLILGVSMRVGNELGANRPEKAWFSMIRSIACEVVMSFTTIFFMVAICYTWGRMFLSDGHIYI